MSPVQLPRTRLASGDPLVRESVADRAARAAYPRGPGGLTFEIEQLLNRS
jgi:hypothetical protein